MQKMVQPCLSNGIAALLRWCSPFQKASQADTSIRSLGHSRT
ncbi:hypothetical protein HMPREF1868_00608 [Olsenella sp. DNF00959]|nr:hypothetical protein HMPREF1868_00608 [Olsenella sp. DNF00959]